MTMPTLIQNYQKKAVVERLKTSYSILTQAIKLSEVENGPVSEWNFELDTEDFYTTYITKYLKSIEKFSPAEYVQNVDIKYLNGIKCVSEAWCTGSNQDTAGFKLVNGTILIVEDPSHAVFAVDINGVKNPNTIGKDIFVFVLQEKTHPSIVPFGMHSRHTTTNGGELFTHENVVSNSFSHGCNKNRLGQYCAGLIMIDGWQISKDYPW